MKILVLDSNQNFQDRLTDELEEAFPGLQLVFDTDPRMALGYAIDHKPDLALLTCSISDGSLFTYLERFRKANVPFILTSHNPDYRLIVEGLRAGAADFFVKGGSSTQVLVQMITRALLQGDRWRHMNAYDATIAHREEYLTIDGAMQSQVESSKASHKPEAARSPASLIDGHYYNFIFVSLAIDLAEDHITIKNDPSRVELLQNAMLDELIQIGESYGALLWNRQSLSAILAFASERATPATLFALEGVGAIVSSELKVEMISKAPGFAFAMASDNLMYSEGTDRLYSDAVNWSMHLAQSGVARQQIAVDERVHQALDPHLVDHFKADPAAPEFEGVPCMLYRPYALP
ncbi:MAG: response regulator [bacterium]|nr:response regulator [bacterium]